MKKPTLKSAKKKAWQAFSIYIRTKDINANGLVECVTCQVQRPVENMQAGHFIDGRTNAILFEEIGCHPQCYACNCMLHGNKIEYYKFMQKKYGEKVIDELRAKKKEIRKFTIQELQDLREYYLRKAEENLK